MKGLLLKDYYLVKSSLWMMVILLVPCALLQLFLFKVVFMPLMPLLFSLIFYLLAANTFSIDNSSKWDKISITFPIASKALVGEKYILHLLSILFGVILGVFLNCAGTIVKADFHFTGYFLHLVMLGVIIPLLAGSIHLPLCYLFGKNSSLMPVFLMLSYIPASVAGFFIRSYITKNDAANTIWLMCVSLLVSALCFFVSFCVSTKIISQKDI